MKHSLSSNPAPPPFSPQNSWSDTISQSTVEQVLERFGLQARPPVSPEGLNTVYRAWCTHIPFDNVQKRIALADGRPGPLPGAYPEEFFADYLAHGTGGTCWSSSGALQALLVALGFPARRMVASMHDEANNRAPSHATVLVRLDGQDYLADSAMLTQDIFPLQPGMESVREDPVHPLRAEPVDGYWRIWWNLAQSDASIPCLILEDDVPLERYLERYEVAREWSGFNRYLFARRNTHDGVAALVRSRRYFKDSTGTITEFPLGSDRERFLIEEWGYSEEIVSRMPEDEPETPRAA
jgi:arylamine N-acetyltransferase